MATIDDVNAEAQGNKLKALQAMASGNTQPYQSGQDAVRSSQNTALDQLARSAADPVQGAPGAYDELKPTVAGPGDAALSAMAGQGDPYANALGAIGATGVAGGARVPSFGGGKQFPVQYYGPYARYGGYGSAGEFDDAVLAAARQHAIDQSTQFGQGAGSAERDLAAHATGGVGAALSAMAPQIQENQRAEASAHLGLGIATPSIVPPPNHDHLGLGTYTPAPPTAFERGAAQHPLEAGMARGMRGDEQATLDPLRLFEHAQQVATDQFHAEPLYAQGHFSPEWAMKLAIEDLTGPNNYLQSQGEYQQRSANGGASDEELRQRAAISDALNNAAIKSSPEYTTGANFIDGAMQAVGSGSKPPTLDETRLALAKLGLPADVIAQLVKDYGGLFPTAGFVNQLPTG